jgi:iron complex transport system ATP-binding protein
VTPVARGASLPPATRGRVLVVCGSGTGAWLLRRLRLAGFDVAGGALNGGDTDEAVARALGLPFVGLPPFATVDAAAEESVAALARGARMVVVCDTPFGGANLGNLRGALAAAPDRVVFVGGDPVSRDFTGGSAAALVAGALGAGATAVADEQEALALVERTLR